VPTTSAEVAPALAVIVDDQLTGRKILEQTIRKISPELEVIALKAGSAVLELVRERTPDLVLTDYLMPEMDGVELIRRLRAISACSDVPVVMITIVEDVQIRYEALDAGATDFLRRPIDEYECRARCRNLLRLREQQKIIRDRSRWLEEQVALATREIRARERETLLRLAKAGEYRDEGTGNHVLRIARYCRIMAEVLGLSPEECADIELASPMHDIGKVGIPDCILLKPGKLDRHEMKIMRRHTTIGYEILKGSPSHYLQLGATIARSHHERYDGTGYPEGLAGDDIPLAARVVSVADVFDALTTTRPYKGPWPMEETIAYIKEHAGGQFDARVVDAFLARVEDIRHIYEHLKDEKTDLATQRERLADIFEVKIADTKRQ
jgi:two-component system, response regulator RpfG